MKQTFFRPIKGIHGERDGKYFYKMADTAHKKPYTRKVCAECGKSAMMQTRASAIYCSRRCSKLGKNNPHWNPEVNYDYSDGYPRELRECGGCGEAKWLIARESVHFCSTQCRASAMSGDNHPNWNPDSAYKKYTKSQMTGFHQRVEKARGSAKDHGCEHCGDTQPRYYHWANVSGNYTDVNDYISLCVPCHYKYDAPKRAAARKAADESQD